MESSGFESLNSFQMDVLTEIGNIGAGNAATALAKMLNKKIDMKVPSIRIMQLSEIGELLGDPEAMVVGVLLSVQGDMKGSIMFVLNLETTQLLVNMIFGKSLDTPLDFDEMTCSAIQELGNILAGSYLSALSTLTNLNIMPGVPSLAIDMAGAVMSVPAIMQAKASDTVLYMENEFVDGEHAVLGDLFLIPDENSYSVLMKALGVG